MSLSFFVQNLSFFPRGKNMFPLTQIKSDIHIEGFNNIYYFEFNKYHHHALESHNFWEMVYVDKGKIIANVNGKSSILEEGQAIFHMPGEEHSHTSNGEVANNMLVVSFTCNNKCMEFFKDKTFTLDKTSKTLLSLFIKEAQNALGKIPNNYNFKGPLTFSSEVFGASQLMKFHFVEFLIKLIRGNAHSKSNNIRPRLSDKSDIIDLIVTYMADNIYNDINLEKLCNKFYLRKSRLSTIFKEFTDKSPMEYFNDLKIKEAKKLLREDNLSVSQITFKLNYSSIHNFSRAFKKITGFSPTGYKKSVLTLQSIEDE